MHVRGTTSRRAKNKYNRVGFKWAEQRKDNMFDKNDA